MSLGTETASFPAQFQVTRKTLLQRVLELGNEEETWTDTEH